VQDGSALGRYRGCGHGTLQRRAIIEHQFE
jgi:hypothetical protein